MSYVKNVVKSVQTGDTTIAFGDTSTTATITSVNTSTSFVTLRMVGATSGDPPFFIALSNATTVTLYKSATTAGITMRWQVIEYY